jgi:hypothetical protein
MKNIFFFFVVLFPFLAFSQVKGDVSIEWSKKSEMTFGNSIKQIPHFEGSSYYYDSNNESLFYNLNLNNPVSFDENSLNITNLIYETISITEIGDLKISNIPNTINASVYSSISRDLRQTFLKITPIIKDGNEYKRVKSFSYTLNTGSARKLNTSKNKNTLSSSVLASGEWYRFYIEKSGVYKIPKNFLLDLGLNLNGIDPKKIKIYGNGGKMLPLSNSIYYPSDLTENAIQIQGENDGVFNDDDFILFYGEGTDNWND